MMVAVIAVEVRVWVWMVVMVARRVRVRAVRMLVRRVTLRRRDVLDLRRVIFDDDRLGRRLRIVAACGEDGDHEDEPHGFFFGGCCDIFFFNAASSSSTVPASFGFAPLDGFAAPGPRGGGAPPVARFN